MSAPSTVLWPTPAALTNRKSRRAMTPSTNNGRRSGGGQSSPPGLEQAVELAEGVTPKEMVGLFTDSNQLTLFAEAFPVSPIVSPADAAPPPTTATSGRSSPDLFASLDPDGSWRKTYPDCSPVRLDGSSVPFSETWPRAGMTVNGRAYQLPPLVRLTDATECGSWPTPHATCSTGAGTQGRDGGLNLQTAVRWPTPTAGDATGSGNRNGTTSQAHAGISLTDAVLTGGSLTPRREVSGSLNPTWVEWLMGYPTEWTACAAWATRSSRRSRSGLPAGSSPPKG